MPKITVLPDILINKIAAGEVIERPASIVRELVDNAIDAGATKIDIEVLHGGKKLIKVADNGSGMNRDDAILCFERHATSKISSEDDLFDITSLGFRGEALSSVASVAKVVLTTALSGAAAGVTIEIGTSHISEIKEAPPLQGTTIEVRDIFYNTPARRKFLKTNPTELSHIIDTVTQKAFAFPDISFTLNHNNKNILSVFSVNDLSERFVQLYGKAFANQFLYISSDSKVINLSGFCSSVDFLRGSKSHQSIFVNTRPIKNSTINHAVYSAYSNKIPKDKHPAYFLFLQIDPKVVDVNVHPAKREVKFERPDEIHSMVTSSIFEALNPGLHKGRMSFKSVPSSETGKSRGHEYSGQPDTQNNSLIREAPSGFTHDNQADFFSSGLTPDIASFFSIGEAFIARVHDSGLQIIDQHAAHERVLYEKLLKKIIIETESLFLPIRIELPVKEFNLIIKHKDLLNDLGLEIEDFGQHNVIIRSVPRELKKADMQSLLLDIADGILQEGTSGISREQSDQKLLKELAARLACHKSVRGSEPLNKEEMTRLMSELESANDPDHCPHGRPTTLYLSLDDLKKMFKRK